MASSTVSQSVQDKIRDLAAKGLTYSEISRVTGYNRHTVSKYALIDKHVHTPLKQFKESLSDILHGTLLDAMALQHNLLISMGEEDVASIPLNEKRQLMRDVNVVFGTVYDKIRLQDGKSTVNSSHHLQVNLAHQHLFPSPTSSGSVGKEVEGTKGNDCGIMSHSPDNHTQAIDNTGITGN